MQKFCLCIPGFKIAIILAIGFWSSHAFVTTQPQQHERIPVLVQRSHLGLTSKDVDDTSAVPVQSISLKDQAQILKAKAERLRQEIKQQQQYRQPKPFENSVSSNNNNNHDNQTKTFLRQTNGRVTNSISLPWSVVTKEGEEGEEYRLYVDVGREEGTWMDGRWGASGKRIPFALDVKFLWSELADESLAAKRMVKDNNNNNNIMGKSSKVFALKTAPFARLRDGFDRMQCYGGAYRIDMANNGRYTARLMVQVEGTKADQTYMYGDVSIPNGYLYFSLPCFGGRIDQLSTKEGIVTVRQIGWRTGWRREESRILGVFRAKHVKDAQRKDPY
jgi:hypothetical protein